MGVNAYKDKLISVEALYEQGIITKKEFDNIKERTIIKEIKDKSDVLFYDMLDSYVSYVSEKLSEPTIAAYRHKIIQFAQYMYDVDDESELLDKKFENFDLGTVKLFFKHLSDNNESLSYMNNIKSALNNFSEYLNFVGIIAPNIGQIKIDNTYYNQRVRYAYHIDEIYKMANSGTLRENVLIRLIFEGGLKRSQVIHIKHQDFNFERRQLVLHDQKTNLLDRVVLLEPETVSLVRRYIRELYSDIQLWNESRASRGRKLREDYGYIFQNIETATPQYPVVQNSLKKVAEKYFKEKGFDGKELEERVSEFTTESVKNSRRVYLFSQGLSTAEVMIKLDDKNFALCNKSKKLVPLLYPESHRRSQ